MAIIERCIKYIVNGIYEYINNTSTLRILLDTEDAKLPVKADGGSAGYDVFSVDNIIIPMQIHSVTWCGFFFIDRFSTYYD